MTESIMTNCSQCPDTTVAHILQNITSTKSLHCRQRGVSILTPQYASETFTQMSQQARIQRGVWKGATDAKYSRCLCAPVRLAGRKKKKRKVQHTVGAHDVKLLRLCRTMKHRQESQTFLHLFVPQEFRRRLRFNFNTTNRIKAMKNSSIHFRFMN